MPKAINQKTQMIKLIKGIKENLNKLANKSEIMEVFEEVKELIMKDRNRNISNKATQVLAETYYRCYVKDGNEMQKSIDMAWKAVERCKLDKTENKNIDALDILTKMQDVLKEMIEERY